MAWMAAVVAGGQSLLGFVDQKNQYKVDKIVGKANAEVQNILKESRNAVAGAASSLNTYLQSRQNQIHLQNTGRTIEAYVTNLSRLQGQAVTGSLMRRIEAAEAMGAMAAQAGARGSAGSATNQMMNSTIQLRAAIAEQSAKSAEGRAVNDLLSHLDVERENMVLGLSDVRFFADLDFMTVQDPMLRKPSLGRALLTAGMAAGQSYTSAGGQFPSIGGLGPSTEGVTLNMTQQRSTRHA